MTQDASLFVLFGATGDLAQRMLLPSLYALERDGLLPASLRILGTARSTMDREGFRTHVGEAIGKAIAAGECNDAALERLLDRCDYQSASVDDPAALAALAARIAALRGDGDTLVHLSTAPKFYGPICEALATGGVADARMRVMLE
jgi:glucose-6-phosphate 1-dehydrogenase